MRSLEIAAVVTALVGGIGFVVSAQLPAGDARVRPAAADSDRNAAAAGAGEKHVFYQWTDERGTVRFARSLADVPEKWRERAGQVEVDAAAFSKGRGAAAGEDAAAAQPAHRVTIYTAPWCGWCRKTIAFLDERDVDYVNKNIEANEAFADELVAKTGSLGIPFVEIDDSAIHGYDPHEMAALLE